MAGAYHRYDTAKRRTVRRAREPTGRPDGALVVRPGTHLTEAAGRDLSFTPDGWSDGVAARRWWPRSESSVTGFSRELVAEVDGVDVVALRGELDVATADGLSDWLIDRAGSLLVVDLSDLTFMDGSGITALVIARNHLREHGGDLCLTRPRRLVRQALEIVDLADWVRDWDPDWDPR